MGRFVFNLPDVGEGIAEAEVVSWHVAVGSAVAEDDPLVDVMTDKATVEIPSPRAGRVLAITGGPGDKVRVGAELLVLDIDNDEAALPPDEAASPGADVAPLAAPTIPTPTASAGPLLTVAKARRTPQTSGRGKIEAGSPPLVRPGQSRSPPPPYGAVPMSLALRCNSFPEPDRPAVSAMPTSTLTLLRGEAPRSWPRGRRAWRGSRRSRSSAFDAESPSACRSPNGEFLTTLMSRNLT